MRLSAVRILIIAVIVIGGIGTYIFRDRLSGDAGGLKIGECFDDPAGATEISNVQHHPCTESHTAEVMFLGKLPDGGGSYPTDATVQAWVESNCVTAWTAYTGKNIDTDTTLELHFYQPTQASWNKGDRGMICYAIRADGAPMTSSVKVGT